MMGCIAKHFGHEQLDSGLYDTNASEHGVVECLIAYKKGMQQRC